VGKLEKWIVGFKLAILLTFIGIGLFYIDTQRLAPSQWVDIIPLVAGGMIIFVAYEGFELIANTAEDIVNPEKTLPRAYYSAVGFVIFLYILVAIVTVGNLPVSQLIHAKDYALAAAAKPFMVVSALFLLQSPRYCPPDPQSTPHFMVHPALVI